MRSSRATAYSGRVLLVVLMFWTLLPFISLFTAALHPVGTYPTGLSWPVHPQWQNFVNAWKVANLGPILKSSTLIVLGTVPITVVIATMAGFALGQLRVFGGRMVMLLFLIGLTLPLEGIIIPLYYELNSFNLIDTRMAVILPLIGLFMPFSVYWMRAHFVNVPTSLTEAARSDGATTWQIFWGIQVPLARPAIISLVIITTIWTWNQFLLPLVLVPTNVDSRTMAGALGAFQGQYSDNIPLLAAGSLLILAPMVIIYIIFQRQFIQAMLQGAVKG
ncbi:MAG: carbohydrate ABC transporter permease [Solirubrobacteraceae bacterium]